MSPGQFRSQVVQNHPHHAQGQGSNGSSMSLQRRQVLVAAQAQAQAQAQAHGHGPTSAQVVAQQLQQGLVITHQSVTSSPGSGSGSASSTPVPSGPRVTINISSHPPPPPYSQAQAQAQAQGRGGPGTPGLMHMQGEQSHLLSFPLADYLALAPPDSPLNLSTASSSAASALSDNGSGITNAGGQAAGLVGAKMGPGLPVVADRRRMGPHAPIIMQSVKSKEVHKPVPQTATAPLSPPPNVASAPGPASQHNYISQVQVNMSASNGQAPGPASIVTAAPTTTTTTTTTHTRNLQIQITGHAPHHVVHSHPHNGVQYATEPVAPHGGRPLSLIHI